MSEVPLNTGLTPHTGQPSGRSHIPFQSTLDAISYVCSAMVGVPHRPHLLPLPRSHLTLANLLGVHRLSLASFTSRDTTPCKVASVILHGVVSPDHASHRLSFWPSSSAFSDSASPTPLGFPEDPRHKPTVGSQEEAFSYERGTPVSVAGITPHSSQPSGRRAASSQAPRRGRARRRALGLGLLQSPRGVRFLMSKVPL
jgi:hypothetical protein